MAKQRIINLALKLDDNTRRGVASFDSNMRRVNRSARGATSSFDRLNRSLGRMLSLFAGVSAAQGIASYVNSWQRLSNQLRTVTANSVELARAQDNLFRIANETRQSLEATAAVYTRLSRAQGNLKITSSEVVDLVTLINKAVATTGATTKEAEAGIIQLSQAFQSGQLAGDELRSVMENLPVIAEAMAAGLGIPFSEFRKQASSLKVEQLAEGLLNSAELIEARFARTQKTFQQGFTILRNELVKFFGEADEGLTITQAIGEAMAQLGKNLDKVAEAFTRLAYTIAAFMTGKAITKLFLLVGKLGALGTLLASAKLVLAGGVAAGAYMAGDYARNTVNKFTGSERFIDFNEPFVVSAQYFENFEKVLELERKNREVGWQKVDYNLDQQLGILNGIKRFFFGGAIIETGADYRAVDYKKATADGLNVKRNEDLAYADDATRTGGMILTSSIIKIAMNNLPKAFEAIGKYLTGILKSLSTKLSFYIQNMADEATIGFKKTELNLISMVDGFFTMHTRALEYTDGVIKGLMEKAANTMDHHELAGFQAERDKIRAYIESTPRDVYEGRSGQLRSQITALEKELAERVAPPSAKGLIDTFIDAFKKEIDAAIKRGLGQTGPTILAPETKGLFRKFFEDLKGLATGGKNTGEAFVENLELIEIGLSGTGGELEKISSKFVKVGQSLAEAYSQYGTAGLFAMGTNFFIKQMNKLSETVTLVAEDIAENARKISSERFAYTGRNRAEFLDSYQQRLDDYRPRDQNVLLRDIERLRNFIDSMDTFDENRLSYTQDAYGAILDISQGGELNDRQADLIREKISQEFGRVFPSDQEAVNFIAGLMNDLGFSDLDKFTFGSSLFNDLFALFQDRMEGFGELPKNTFEAAVRWFSSQKTIQGISDGPQLLALFQEAFSEIASIDFEQGDLSLAIEPLKDLTTNQIVQLEEMFVQTRMSAMEDGYNSLIDEDKRLAQLYFEGEAIAARTKLRDAYELAGQDTFLQAAALEDFKNTIDSIRISIQQANAAALQTGETLTGELLSGPQELDLSSGVENPELQTTVNVDDLVSYQIDPYVVSNELSQYGRVVADGVANFFAGVPITTVRLIDLIDFDSSEIREAIEGAVSEAISDRRVLGYRG